MAPQRVARASHHRCAAAAHHDGQCVDLQVRERQRQAASCAHHVHVSQPADASTAAQRQACTHRLRATTTRGGCAWQACTSLHSLHSAAAGASILGFWLERVMSERHDLRCVASLTAAPGLAIKAVSCFCITVSRRSSAQNTRIGRISSPRRPPGRLERLAIALAYRKTLARLCRGRLGLGAIGVFARRGCNTATPQRYAVFLARLSARSERRRTCSCGNPARRLLGRATTHAACEPTREIPGARHPVASRLHAIDAREPATSAKLGPRRLKQRGG